MPVRSAPAACSRRCATSSISTTCECWWRSGGSTGRRPRCWPPPPDPDGDEETLREFVARTRLSHYFTDRFLRPLVAAVWSCDPGRALDYPARYLFVFLDHHGMLTVFGSPTWRTVVGGSRSYVEKVADGSRRPSASAAR